MNAAEVKPATGVPGRGWALAAWISFTLAVACALGELLAGPGYRWGWWGLGMGLQTMRWAATLAAAVFVITMLGAAVAHRRRQPRPVSIFRAATVLSLLAVAPLAYLWVQVQQLPRIHDVSTDTENPPRYVDSLPLRKGAPNSTEYDAAIAELQRKAYPDIVPVSLELPTAQAFQLAERVARSMGWAIVAAVPVDLRIEATATTLLFGFKDDVVIRVTPNGAGSRVDLRSLSRIGVSDLGTNARRIRKFIEKLKSQAAV